MIRAFKIKLIPYTLQFKVPAGTSRDIYTNHKIWYVVVYSPKEPNRWGVGECAPLVDLSCDYNELYEDNLRRFCSIIEEKQSFNKEELRTYPSMLFGLETAFQHFERSSFELWQSNFSRGTQGIPINGLIWMGNYSYMLQQIEAKLTQGFRCIKLKIGAINFEKELKLLKHIRSHFSAKEITLRVDANGAFSPESALDKLKKLAELDLHSIEQPIRAGLWSEMAYLAQNTPLPIALDEELIGVHSLENKKQLLEKIRPQYIILKPTLHGGLMGSDEWITLANSLGIGWWITSALESNVGLNAVSQWCATYSVSMAQGLGTGSLYTNNLKMPLHIKGDCLWYNPSGETIQLNDLQNLL